MGTRVTRAAPHLSLEEVKRRMKREPRWWVRQQWWIIYHALVEPRQAEEIARHTGVSIPTVRRVIAATRDPTDQRPILKMAQDEGRFGRISVPRRAWAPPGIRPRSPRQVVREYTYVYAAVAPAEGKMTSLILPMADTAMMNLFLEHVATTFADYFIVMQVDQAGWHQANDLQVPENIRLIPQPAYSPQLNPTEHIWEDLREKQFPNVACSSLDEVIDRLCEGLIQLESEPQRLRSMTYFPHFRRAS